MQTHPGTLVVVTLLLTSLTHRRRRHSPLRPAPSSPSSQLGVGAGTLALPFPGVVDVDAAADDDGGSTTPEYPAAAFSSYMS